MRNPFTRLADAALARQKRLDHDAVAGRLRPWVAFPLIGLVMVAGAMADGTVAGSVGSLFVAAMAGVACAGPLSRRIAFRRGWFDGRLAMIRSMEEASKRGISFPDWLLGEFERDFGDLNGLSPRARRWRRRRRAKLDPPLDGSHEDLP